MTCAELVILCMKCLKFPAVRFPAGEICIGLLLVKSVLPEFGLTSGTEITVFSGLGADFQWRTETPWCVSALRSFRITAWSLRQGKSWQDAWWWGQSLPMIPSVWNCMILLKSKWIQDWCRDDSGDEQLKFSDFFSYPLVFQKKCATLRLTINSNHDNMERKSLRKALRNNEEFDKSKPQRFALTNKKWRLLFGHDFFSFRKFLV